VHVLRTAEYSIKSGLIDYSDSRGTRNNYAGNGIRLFSIVEFIRKYDVPKDEFIELLHSHLYKWDQYPEIEYNVDLIYSNDPRLEFMLNQNVDPAVIDRMYQTNDGIFRDDLIYGLAVEAINNGREARISEVNRAIEADRSGF
jgi:hypothetical protein